MIADEFSSDEEDTFLDLPDLELAELVVPPPSSELNLLVVDILLAVSRSLTMTCCCNLFCFPCEHI